MRLLPLYDRVIVREIADDTETKTEAGLVLPRSVVSETLSGEVVAIGCGREREDGTFSQPLVDVGDVVIFHPAVGRDVTVDGIDYRILREGEILAILNDADESDDEAEA